MLLVVPFRSSAPAHPYSTMSDPALPGYMAISGPYYTPTHSDTLSGRLWGQISGRHIYMLDGRSMRIVLETHAVNLPDDDLLLRVLDTIPSTGTPIHEDLHQLQRRSLCPRCLGLSTDVESSSSVYGPLQVTRAVDETGALFRWTLGKDCVFGASRKMPLFGEQLSFLINSIFRHLVGVAISESRSRSRSRVLGSDDIFHLPHWVHPCILMRACPMELPLWPTGSVYDDVPFWEGEVATYLAVRYRHHVLQDVWQEHLPYGGQWRRTNLKLLGDMTRTQTLEIEQALGWIIPINGGEEEADDKSTATYISKAEQRATIRVLHRLAKHRQANPAVRVQYSLRESMACTYCMVPSTANAKALANHTLTHNVSLTRAPVYDKHQVILLLHLGLNSIGRCPPVDPVRQPTLFIKLLLLHTARARSYMSDRDKERLRQK